MPVTVVIVLVIFGAILLSPIVFLLPLVHFIRESRIGEYQPPDLDIFREEEE